MIPLLLLSHFGYLSSYMLSGGGRLLGQAADLFGAPWLALGGLWGAPPTGYVSPLCILLGLACSLGVSRWVAGRSAALPARPVRLYFGLWYAAFAAWNLYAAWPGTAGAAAVHDAGAAAEALDGWSILWPFLGINAVMVALALIARRTAREQDAGAEKPDFSAARSWVIRDAAGGRQTAIYDWLVEQAILAGWRVPPLVSLGNAAQEIITFLQRTLPPGAPIRAGVTLRKNRAVMTVSHEGQPLSLPDYKAPPSLDEADTDALEGIELRLAVAQVEHMSYQARLSEGRCSFTLRQSC